MDTKEEKCGFNVSPEERADWIGVILSSAMLGYYFVKVLYLPGGLNADTDLVTDVLVKTVIFSIVVAIVLGIVNGILFKNDSDLKDERDNQIKFRGYRNAFYACTSCLWVLIVGALLNEKGLPHWDWEPRIQTMNLFIHSIFFLGWMTCIVQYGTHIYYYRRGIV